MTINRNLTNQLILITDSHVDAGSATDHIYVRFGIPSWLPGGGPVWNLRINAAEFHRSTPYSVNFNSVSPASFFDDMPCDHWDHVRLETPTTDGLGIHRIALFHNDEEILNIGFAARHWLDRRYGTVLDMTHDILMHKRSIVGNTHYPVISYAVEELGKTDGYKYGTGSQWCSEFAAWCLRKSVEWDDVPFGSIASDNLIDYFRDKRRLVSGTDVINGVYTLGEGDYLQLNGATHSGLFYQYIDGVGGNRIDPPDSPSGSTWIRCIEGNVGPSIPRAVRVVDRQLNSIDNVGKTH